MGFTLAGRHGARVMPLLLLLLLLQHKSTFEEIHADGDWYSFVTSHACERISECIHLAIAESTRPRLPAHSFCGENRMRAPLQPPA